MTGPARTLSFNTDVLVVGAGVTGLTVSALLAAHQVPTITVARHSGTAPSPRAHITNQRTMEIFRDMGIEERVKAIGIPLKRLGANVLATSFTGLEIGRYDCYGAGAAQSTDFASASPCEMWNAPQHVLEPVLLELARENGAEVRWSTELTHIEQRADHVVARLRQRETDTEYSVRARYVVGADGARSPVAEQTGFAFEGESGLMSMVSSWLEVDLSPHTAYRPAAIYWMMQPGNDYWVGTGTWICVRPFDEWVLTRQYDPAEGNPDTSDAAIVAFARTTIGDPHAVIRVKDVSQWEVNNMVATEYRRGRVLLAGDAAHRHPPASGLGSNTCVQDAYNLAWKLAMVLSGNAGEALLDSYDEERRPVGEQIVEAAIQSLHNVRLIPRVLGFKSGQSRSEGWASLEALYANEPGGSERRAALAEAVDLQHRRSNALGVHLGQRYESSAIVDDGTPFPEPARDPHMYYEPTTHPGAHLPHAWLQRNHGRVSTIDLAGHGRFSLVVGIGGRPWARAAAAVEAALGIDLPVRFVGYRCDYDDVLGDWRKLREVTDDGALLVRPDRHVAWRCADLPEDPERALREALGHVLSFAEATPAP
jgi:2,4-dichlorophenol 6-monooxygenase